MSQTAAGSGGAAAAAAAGVGDVDAAAAGGCAARPTSSWQPAMDNGHTPQ